MQTATVSEQGQVIIPLDIRKQLGITHTHQAKRNLFVLNPPGLGKPNP